MRKLRLKIAAIAMMLPFAANAAIVEYTFDGFDGGDGWTATGSISVGLNDVLDGGDLLSDLIAWSFEWTNGVDFASLDSSNSFIDTSTGVAASFFADTTSVLGGTTICFAGIGMNCNTGGFPVMLVTDAGWVATTNAAPPVTNGNTLAPGSWTATTVPAPGAIALLGMGLVGMGLARRRRTA